jgi:hypothetical protein
MPDPGRPWPVDPARFRPVARDKPRLCTRCDAPIPSGVPAPTEDRRAFPQGFRCYCPDCWALLTGKPAEVTA